jgi:hypothetical protein
MLDPLPEKLTVRAANNVGLRWTGPALVDGKPWPIADADTIWLPAGTHTIQPAANAPALRMLDFNGELISVSAQPGSIEFGYRSSAQALAILERPPQRVEIDGLEAHPPFTGKVLTLPRGQHLVTLQ